MKKVLVALLLALTIFAPVFAQGSKESASITAEGKTKLTYWAPIKPELSSVAQDFSQTEIWKAIMEETNTEITFSHVSAGNDSTLSEGFNIMVASGDYADVIEYKWIDYPGGPQAAIDDGVIIRLNEVFEKYCPNITAYLNEHPDIAKMISTDDGSYYCFPFLRGESYKNNNLVFTEGWVWRMDLLKKVGITEVPETPEELYTALVKLKDAGVEIPLCIRKDHVSRVLSPAFDAWDDFYVVDGVVKHGYLEDNRKDYLEYTAKLYKEGLLDNDYLSVDKKSLGVKVLNNLCAGAYAPGGSGIGTWLPAMRQSDPTVELVSARPLSPEKDRYSMFAKMSNLYDKSGSSAAISTSCKNVEAVAKFLDYNYSEEGHLLNNFGVEGVSYNMVDGYPQYTALVVDNPDLPISQALAMYTRAGNSGPFIQDPRYLEQYYELPELQDAINLWAQTDYGMYIYPPASTNSEEASELAQIMNNVKTYAEEMETKFITGALSLDKFEEYQAQLKKFGLERAVEIKQAAYDRYISK